MVPTPAGILYLFIAVVRTVPKEKCPLSLCWFSSHWPIPERLTFWLKASFSVSTLMPEKYQQSKRQSIFKPKTPSWLKVRSSARCPSLPPCFPGTTLQKSGCKGRVQGGFCRLEQLLDRRAGWSASQEIISAASIFPSCQVQGAEEGVLSPDSPGMMSTYPEAGHWGIPIPAVNLLTPSTRRSPGTLSCQR